MNRLTLWAMALTCFVGENPVLETSQLAASLRGNGVPLDDVEMNQLTRDLQAAGLVKLARPLSLTEKGERCRDEANFLTSAPGTSLTLLAAAERELRGRPGRWARRDASRLIRPARR